LPIRTLQADGETGPFGLPPSATGAEEGGMSWFWPPLLGLLLLLLGYWGGVWYKGRRPRTTRTAPLRARLGSGLSLAASTLTSSAADLAKRLNPEPLIGKIKPKLSRSLPASTRFLICVREANREDEPAAWAERFADMTCHHLKFDSQTSLPGVTGKILALRPGADRETVESLMRQLDGALYGNQDIDFERWKKQFRHQVGRGRGLASFSGRTLHLSRARLPELNPQTGS
jgi:hypothetical protein